MSHAVCILEDSCRELLMRKVDYDRIRVVDEEVTPGPRIKIWICFRV